MTDKDLGDYWEECWARLFTEDGKVPSRFVQKVCTFLDGKGITQVLDLGSGNGRDAFYLTARGYEVTALDISSAALTHIKEKAPQIKCICSDIAAYNYPARTYDMVLSNLSLHYWDDETTRRIVAQIARCLKPGGYFCLTCKSTKDPSYGVGEKIDENIYLKEYVRHFFDKNYMADILQDFEIIEMEESKVSEKHYGNYVAVSAIARLK